MPHTFRELLLRHVTWVWPSAYKTYTFCKSRQERIISEVSSIFQSSTPFRAAIVLHNTLFWVSFYKSGAQAAFSPFSNPSVSRISVPSQAGRYITRLGSRSRLYGIDRDWKYHILLIFQSLKLFGTCTVLRCPSQLATTSGLATLTNDCHLIQESAVCRISDSHTK